jgi:excisionase family DNA binding protein
VKTIEVPAPKFLPVKLFAALVGLSIWTIRQWAYSGKISSAKLGSRLMIPATELDRLMEETMRPRQEER